MAQPPPRGEAATYPAKEIAGIVAFLKNVTAKSDPVVRDEFFALVTGFGEGRGNAGAVVARATEILGGRPDLLAQFRACLAGTPEAPNEGLAATRPRRSNRSRPVLMTTEEPDVSDGAAVEVKKENGFQRKRERERARRAAKRASAAAAGVAHGEEEEDPRLREALAFLNRVMILGGPEALSKFLQVMYVARDDGRMDAGAIYDAVREAFGPAHGHLLPGFADFLPREAEWEEQEARRRERKRRHRVGDHAPSSSAPSVAANKKPRQACSGYDEASVQRGRDDGELLLFKARTGDMNHSRPAQSSAECSGGSRGHDDHDVARCRADKKPRADDDIYSSRKSLRISEGGGSSIGAAATARVQDTNNRRTSNGDGAGSSVAAPAVARNGGQFDRFRALWEFATRYSILMATMARTEELIELLGDEPVPDGVYSLDLQKLFPSRDSREFLERLYGDRWREMKRGLEDGGLGVRALRVVLDSLRWAEAEAVKDATERRDHARAAEGLYEFVAERVDEERRRSWHTNGARSPAMGSSSTGVLIKYVDDHTTDGQMNSDNCKSVTTY